MTEHSESFEAGAKTTVQSTALGKAVCERLQSEGFFNDGQSAFRFAVCFALSNEMSGDSEETSNEAGKGLTWSVTGLDPNQILKFLVSEFSVGDRPLTQREQYRRIEVLGNLGLAEIGRRLQSGASISELVG